MKTIRNEYKQLKKENDLIFSTLAECDRDTITDIVNTIRQSRGINYEVELVRKDLIAMAASAEADGRIPARRHRRRGGVQAEPAGQHAQAQADRLHGWTAWCGCARLRSGLRPRPICVLGGPWDCYYDAVWLVLCIAMMMPSAWLLQRIVPAEWRPLPQKGVRYGAHYSRHDAFVVCGVLVRRQMGLRRCCPTVGLPNVVAVVLLRRVHWQRCLSGATTAAIELGRKTALAGCDGEIKKCPQRHAQPLGAFCVVEAAMCGPRLSGRRPSTLRARAGHTRPLQYLFKYAPKSCCPSRCSLPWCSRQPSCRRCGSPRRGRR